MPKAKPGVGLNRKSIGGLPLWAVIIGGAASLYLVYHVYKSRAGSAASSPASTAPASGVDTSGGAGSSAAGPNDLAQPFEDLAFALNGLTGILGSGGSFTTTTDPAQTSTQSQTAPVSSASTSPYINSFNPGSIFTDSTGKTFALQPAGVFEPAYIGPSGSYVSPETYAGAGVAPAAITSSEVSAPLAQATIPAPPHATSTVIMPAPTPKPAPTPVSGYNRKTVANIH